MQYKVELIHSSEGYAVGCPELPGCWSQGETEADALENIKSAIYEYLSVMSQDAISFGVEKTVMFVDVAEPERENKAPLGRPFKVVPLAMGLPHFTKVEDLLDVLEGPDRR